MLSNCKGEIQPTLINLHPNEFHYYPFVVKLDRCIGNCNTLNVLSDKVCFQNKTKDLNVSMFNMITGINESGASTNYISYEYKCKFDGTKCKLEQR